MALVVASRPLELAALDLRLRIVSPDGVSFQLPMLTKKRRVGTPPHKIFIGTFPQDKRHCIVKFLREYEQRTKEFRATSTEAPDKPFLSYVQPHNPISSRRFGTAQVCVTVTVCREVPTKKNAGFESVTTPFIERLVLKMVLI